MPGTCQHRPALNLSAQTVKRDPRGQLRRSRRSGSAEVAKRDRAVTLLDQDDGEPHSRKIERVRIVNPFR